MRFTISAKIRIEAEDKDKAADAAKKIFAGIWDLVPENPRPGVTVRLFDGTHLLHTIATGKRLRGPRR